MSDKPARKPAIGWVVVVLALGMLIWVRLRLVTDIPRSAYADPQRQSAPGDRAADGATTRDDAAASQPGAADRAPQNP